MARPRHQARLTSGGLTWDLRDKKTIRPTVPSKAQRQTLEELRQCLLGIREALVHRDLARGWALRREAWDHIDKLPPYLTWKHRKALSQYKVLLRAAAQQDTRRPRS